MPHPLSPVISTVLLVLRVVSQRRQQQQQQHYHHHQRIPLVTPKNDGILPYPLRRPRRMQCLSNTLSADLFHLICEPPTSLAAAMQHQEYWFLVSLVCRQDLLCSKPLFPVVSVVNLHPCYNLARWCLWWRGLVRMDGVGDDTMWPSSEACRCVVAAQA